MFAPSPKLLAQWHMKYKYDDFHLQVSLSPLVFQLCLYLKDPRLCFEFAIAT
jgi:hypothetical protein